VNKVDKMPMFQTVKSLTEAIKRLEANARDSAAFDDPASRCLQHSASCGTIIIDPRSAGRDAVVAAAANGMLSV